MHNFDVPHASKTVNHAPTESEVHIKRTTYDGVGVQKEGRTFVPLYLCTGSRSRAHGHTKQNRGGEPR